jgi:hypothetical protein
LTTHNKIGFRLVGTASGKTKVSLTNPHFDEIFFRAKTPSKMAQ